MYASHAVREGEVKMERDEEIGDRRGHSREARLHRHWHVDLTLAWH